MTPPSPPRRRRSPERRRPYYFDCPTCGKPLGQVHRCRGAALDGPPLTGEARDEAIERVRAALATARADRLAAERRAQQPTYAQDALILDETGEALAVTPTTAPEAARRRPTA